MSGEGRFKVYNNPMVGDSKNAFQEDMIQTGMGPSQYLAEMEVAQILQMKFPKLVVSPAYRFY